MLSLCSFGGTQNNGNLSLDELVAQCVIFFLAGYDTTSSTLSLATYELALNPDVQEKVYQEIVDTLKEANGELTYDTLKSMKYLDCIISETLRLYPPVLRNERQSVAEYTLGDTGITIPKNMLISIPVFAMHRDPEFFPNPDKFDPDRFTPEERQKRDPYCYQPFGAGPRNCVGMRFVLTEVKLCLAYVIANFKIKKSPKTQVPLKFLSGQTGLLQLKNIYVSLIPRDNNPMDSAAFMYDRHYEGTKPVLMVAEPSLLRDIFVKDFHIFPNRRTFQVGDPIIDKMVSVVQGEDWKRIRTVITPTFSTGKIKRTRNDFLQLLMDTAKELSEDPKSELNEKDHEDIASTYGGVSTDHQIFKSVTKKNLSMDELVAQCVIFFLAGYDTTASTLSLATYELALNPDIQEKVHQELVDTLKETNGELTYDALQSMKYLDCIISETLRLYPPALRFTLEERQKRDPYCYQPFGAGPRNCVGMRFALMEVKLCLAYVIANFKIKKSPKTQVPLKFLSGQAGLLQPKNIYVSMIPRDDNPIVK
ncbi:unnamed protein product [Larinioides sclopetarius]|uniref:Cytochrome P450 n=1 Tax=Larinioides sclopetarius TaxID=280406 RepID=A0AAV2B2E2_9ARAC